MHRKCEQCTVHWRWSTEEQQIIISRAGQWAYATTVASTVATVLRPRNCRVSHYTIKYYSTVYRNSILTPRGKNQHGAEPKLFIVGSAAPPLSITSAPAPAPVIIYYNSSIIYEICLNEGFSSSSKLTAVNIYWKDNFGSGSRFQIISAPPSPTPQHWYKCLKKFHKLIKGFENGTVGKM